MRVLPVAVAVLHLTALAGCATGPESVAGDAGPAGAPPEIASAAVATPSPSLPAPDPASPPASAPSSQRTSSPASPSASASASAAASASAPPPAKTIRDTDWADVKLADLPQYGDLAFSGGKASKGANNCHMLPGGARPYYAEYLAEEPANSPVTEDALILIDCGSDMQQQMLVPVQLGYDRKTRQAVGFIKADPPPAADKSMTFTSYRVEKGVIVTEVRKADGSTETRRYRFGGGNSWDRI